MENIKIKSNLEQYVENLTVFTDIMVPRRPRII